ncbi:MAG TPA: type II toxin-antitoxin system RelE/ParE family toxin [Acidimicrobiia bacterium]|nr:type II toxin-antitoxin system RelE/ParE family toxin [Acidimicrobiia bacterium]
MRSADRMTRGNARSCLVRSCSERPIGSYCFLDAAENLNDLRIPPDNRLEKLKGDRKGHHSMRVNQQWRICFRWTDAGAEDVEIVDYH